MPTSLLPALVVAVEKALSVDHLLELITGRALSESLSAMADAQGRAAATAIADAQVSTGSARFVHLRDADQHLQAAYATAVEGFEQRSSVDRVLPSMTIQRRLRAADSAGEFALLLAVVHHVLAIDGDAVPRWLYRSRMHMGRRDTLVRRNLRRVATAARGNPMALFQLPDAYLAVRRADATARQHDAVWSYLRAQGERLPVRVTWYQPPVAPAVLESIVAHGSEPRWATANEFRAWAREASPPPPDDVIKATIRDMHEFGWFSGFDRRDLSANPPVSD